MENPARIRTSVTLLERDIYNSPCCNAADVRTMYVSRIRNKLRSRVQLQLLINVNAMPMCTSAQVWNSQIARRTVLDTR